MKNSINWFEIPASDFDRAKAFYSSVLGLEITEMPMPDSRYAVFPYDRESEGIGGGIMQMEGFKPSAEGSVIYLNGGDDLNVPLSRVESSGGKVVIPKTSIGENGFMAHFLDTEGNRVAFHSMN